MNDSNPEYFLDFDFNSEENKLIVDFFAKHHSLKIEVVDESYYVNESFYIYPTKVSETIKTIAGEYKKEYIKFHVTGVVYIPATYWHPEEDDEQDISQEKNLTNAFKRCIIAEFENNLENSLSTLDYDLQELYNAEADKDCPF